MVHASPVLGSRELFPLLSGHAYLNHAAISPLCKPVQDALGRCVEDYAENGAAAFPRWEAQRAELRVKLANLFGALPEEVGLGTNTTRGVTDVALAIPWGKGDRILLFEGEFPANVTPWQLAARQFGLRVEFLRAEGLQTPAGLEAVEKVLRRGVRLVAVSFVQFQSGTQVPVSELAGLCHKYGAELFVDGIQGCGAVPLNLREAQIDYMSCGGHKWLLGTEGAGFIFIAHERAASLRPLTAGWLSHDDPVGFLFRGGGHLRYDRPLRARADVFEGGTFNTLGFAALEASVSLIAALGVDSIFEHIQAYHDALEPHLVECGFISARAPAGYRSGILSAKPPPGRQVAALAAALRAQGVVVGTPDGHLRFAPHFSNSLDEIPRVAEALREACSV